jgi:hypothetical protein
MTLKNRIYIISLEQALREGISPASIRAVAEWNKQKAHTVKGSEKDRFNAQAIALGELAYELERKVA